MFSIQVQQALAKLVLPFLILIACSIVVLGLARRPLVDRWRLDVADGLAPAYRLAAWPGEAARGLYGNASGLGHLALENAHLRDENAKLRRWYDVAVALANENARLKAQLHWIPDNAPSFVTGHVVRDAGGVYGRALLLSVGDGQGVQLGDVALDAGGLIGRVTEVGAHVARILLINDQASRIPVTLTASRGAAILAGDGSPYPRLLYYAQDNHPVEGERVFTSAQALPVGQSGHAPFTSLPGGLPIGTVHYSRPGDPVVVPDGSLVHPDIVRVFHYDQQDETGPSAPGRVPVQPPALAPELSDPSSSGAEPGRG